MKILFVCSGNSSCGVGPVVNNQAQSLISFGVVVEFFLINGKGALSYLRHVFLLRNFLKKNNFDLIHAHYSLSGFVATLSGCKPLVISLMGSDTQTNYLITKIIQLLHRYRWKYLIVKSLSMQNRLKLNKYLIIPNGVDLSLFKPLNRCGLKNKFNFSRDKHTVLFLADSKRKSKNFELANKAFKILNSDVTELCVRNNLSTKTVPEIISAADTVLLTSKWEGSPNVIKEAMACNCPVVATNVGDVAWLFGNQPGYFITSFEPEDVAEKIKLAIDFCEKNGRTDGRKRIIDLELDTGSIAKKIIQVYEKAIRDEN